VALLVLGLAAILQVSEGTLLHFASLTGKDGMLSTVVYGVGMFLLAFHIHRAPGAELVARLGTYGLGLYCVHLMVLRTLVAVIQPHHFVQVVAIVFGTLGLSALAAFAASRVKELRPVVA
jgi:hypothetical protein